MQQLRWSHNDRSGQLARALPRPNRRRARSSKSVIAGRSYPICKRHQGGRWNLFVDGGWLYAIDLKAEPVVKPKRKKKK